MPFRTKLDERFEGKIAREAQKRLATLGKQKEREAKVRNNVCSGILSEPIEAKEPLPAFSETQEPRQDRTFCGRQSGNSCDREGLENLQDQLNEQRKLYNEKDEEVKDLRLQLNAARVELNKAAAADASGKRYEELENAKKRLQKLLEETEQDRQKLQEKVGDLEKEVLLWKAQVNELSSTKADAPTTTGSQNEESQAQSRNQVNKLNSGRGLKQAHFERKASNQERHKVKVVDHKGAKDLPKSAILRFVSR